MNRRELMSQIVQVVSVISFQSWMVVEYSSIQAVKDKVVSKLSVHYTSVTQLRETCQPIVIS